MQPIALDQVKQIELEILRDIDAFCRKCNLRYQLNSGTLLGAIRHRGFIPWDDDIDIAMPRE
ncbi:phosphorylcholine transferase LicD, partial [Eubacterium callanderi]|nr:phosphorylcholine transferase LicD [Eubacterium callanderi]